MMYPSTLKPLAAVAAISILAIAGVAAQERQQPAPKGGTVKATPLSPLDEENILPPFEEDAGAAKLADDRARARRQLAVIDEAWAMLENLSRSGRIEINGGTIGPWGRRRLEALRRAGAEKAEIVAALKRYSNDLGRFEEICHGKHNHHHPSYDEYEVKYLRMEAEFWLKEEKAR